MPYYGNRRWPDDKIARLRTLHAEGLTFDQIGTRMGISGNAVAGKCWRLGLVKKPAGKRTERPWQPPLSAEA